MLILNHILSKAGTLNETDTFIVMISKEYYKAFNKDLTSKIEEQDTNVQLGETKDFDLAFFVDKTVFYVKTTDVTDLVVYKEVK